MKLLFSSSTVLGLLWFNNDPFANASCNSNDVQNWRSRGGIDEIGGDAGICFETFEGGCLSGPPYSLDEGCLRRCAQQSLGYSSECSVCFGNAGSCIWDSDCILTGFLGTSLGPCAVDSNSQSCEDCISATTCENKLFECGLPEDLTTPSPTPRPTTPSPTTPPTPTPCCRTSTGMAGGRQSCVNQCTPTSNCCGPCGCSGCQLIPLGLTGGGECTVPIPPPTPLPTPDPTPSPTPAPTPSPTPDPTPSPTPAPTPSPTPGPTKAPSGNPTPVATSGPIGACSNNDIRNWRSRGGIDEIGADASFCITEFNGGCLFDMACVEECVQQSLGYSSECSGCFANGGDSSLAECVLEPCGLTCANDGGGQGCLDCIFATDCDEIFFVCSGLPEDITTPSPTPPSTPPPITHTQTRTSPTGDTSSGDASCAFKLITPDIDTYSLPPIEQNGLDIMNNYIVCDDPYVTESIAVSLFKLPETGECSSQDYNNINPVVIQVSGVPEVTDICYEPGSTEQVTCTNDGSLERLVTSKVSVLPEVQENNDFYSIDEDYGKGVVSFCTRISLLRTTATGEQEEVFWDDRKVRLFVDIEDGSFVLQNPIVLSEIIPPGGISEFVENIVIHATSPSTFVKYQEPVKINLEVLGASNDLSEIARIETVNEFVFRAYDANRQEIATIDPQYAFGVDSYLTDGVDNCNKKNSCSFQLTLSQHFFQAGVANVRAAGVATLELYVGQRILKPEETEGLLREPEQSYLKEFVLELGILPSQAATLSPAEPQEAPFGLWVMLPVVLIAAVVFIVLICVITQRNRLCKSKDVSSSIQHEAV